MKLGGTETDPKMRVCVQVIYQVLAYEAGWGVTSKDVGESGQERRGQAKMLLQTETAEVGSA